VFRGEIHWSDRAGIFFFCLPENMQSFNSIFFFAAGSGIAPIYSMIKTVLHQYPLVRVFLIYSNQSIHTAVFYQQLKQLELQFNKNLRIHFYRCFI